MTTNSSIPGGILEGTEFFTVFSASGESEAMCIHGGHRYELSGMPAAQREVLTAAINSRPALKRDIAAMVGNNEEAMLNQFVMCRYGALNNEPDIACDGTLSEPEYVPCRKRGTCPFEGKVCSMIMFSPGILLSRSETEIFKLVALPDKNIADQLNLSVETVKKHFKNIRIKTGLNTKIEMAVWATQKGIIQWQ